MAKLIRKDPIVTPPVPVPPAPIDIPAVDAAKGLAPLPINEASPYLKLGDYPRAAWVETLAQNSPLRDEIEGILVASQGVGILAREQALKESSDGTDATARQARNPLGIMVRSANEPHIVTGAGRMLKTFPNFTAAFSEFKRRITSPNDAYLSVGVETLGEYIERYLMGWIPGDPNRPNPPGESMDNLKLYKSQIISRSNARAEHYGREGGESPEEPEEPAGPLEGFVSWDVPGLGYPLILPEGITVEVILTPVGVHRPGRKIDRTGSTLHETGNRGNGSGARMHSNWQDGCTQGHPDGYVGVSMYVENRLVLIKIPLNENSIHSGDWRNNAHDSMEVCVNADRNARVTEDTAMWVKASVLHGKGQNAKDHLYPHHPSGCPAIINGRGGWHGIEDGVDERITVLRSGGSVPPSVEYAEAFPVSKEWDGTDYVRNDGHRFYALQRVFVTAKDTPALQSADPQAPKVRADLKKGEAFLSHYITEGAGGMWLVSQFGSRILAADCLPRLGVLNGTVWMGDQSDDVEDIILNEAHRGLSAAEVPEDAPALDKATFMGDQ